MIFRLISILMQQGWHVTILFLLTHPWICEYVGDSWSKTYVYISFIHTQHSNNVPHASWRAARHPALCNGHIINVGSATADLTACWLARLRQIA
jgi:hypothetical protein